MQPQEWRKIEEFPKYLMNPQGDIRRKSTSILKKTHTNKTNDQRHYIKLSRNGQTHHIPVDGLKSQTYPELYS